MRLFQLGEPSCGRLVAEGAMPSFEVVMVEPAGERRGALCGAAVDGSVGPAAGERLDEALRLAVGAGPVGAGEAVAEAQLVAGDCVDARAIASAVVAHDPLDLHLQ